MTEPTELTDPAELAREYNTARYGAVDPLLLALLHEQVPPLDFEAAQVVALAAYDAGYLAGVQDATP